MTTADLKTLLDSTVALIKTEFLTAVPEAAGQELAAIESYVKDLEGRSALLLINLEATNDAKFLVARLTDEKTILQSEVLTIVQIGEVLAQSLINSITTILLNAAQTVLNSVQTT